MQPVQDLTVEDRISRTQYQYALDAPDKALLDLWVPRLVDRMKQIPELRDVASDQQNNGLGLLGQYRPRYRRPAGHHSAEHRRRALRCLRPAAGIDHLHADQPVPRDSRSGAAMPAGYGCAEGHVRADRIGFGRIWHRPSRWPGTNTALTGAAALAPAPLGSFVTRRLRFRRPSPSTTRASSRW